MVIFLDTSAWLALLNKSDHLYRTANQIWRELQRQRARFVTSEFVLLELANALAQPLFRSRIRSVVRDIQTKTYLEIVPLSSALLNEAWNLFESRPDKSWGITDCTSFVIMAEQNIKVALTADQHFVQAGFRKLL
jgi:predicted nucleic acid-binding protein